MDSSETIVKHVEPDAVVRLVESSDFGCCEELFEAVHDICSLKARLDRWMWTDWDKNQLLAADFLSKHIQYGVRSKGITGFSFLEHHL